MTIKRTSESARVATVLVLGVLVGMPLIAAESPEANGKVVARGAEVLGPVIPIPTQRLDEIPVARSWRPGDAIREIPRRSFDIADPNAAKFSAEGVADPLAELQDRRDAEGRAPTLMLGVNIDGQGYTGATPPDTVGDVGPNHYVQAVNATRIAIYDKTGVMLSGYPKDLSDLAPAGDSCNTNPWGDPIVLYDQLADRWFLQEFDSGTSNLCIYISQTPDPTGAYYFYKFSPRPDHDYPHFGVWTDAYYGTINRGSEVNALAFDRASMLAGAPATAQFFNSAPSLPGYGFQTLSPADHDGTQPPPAGAPGIFMRQNDDEAHTGSPSPTDDYLEIWAFAVDWATPANSTFTALTPITITDFNSWLVNYTTFASIPQPGTSQRIDPIREAILQRLAYRNFGAHEAIVGNFITNEDPATSGSTVDGATRWFELRRTGGDWSLFQEGTYGPGTAATNHFMGGIAMDGQGNIGLGYSKTDTAVPVYPSIGVTGRLVTDPPGTMAAETDAVLGTQSQTGTERYGDYAALGIDPADDCTFWYTNEYIAGSNWSTRITSFVFEECTYGFTLTPTPATRDVCALGDPDPEYVIDVSGTAGWTGFVTLDDGGSNPAGTTSSFVPTGGDVDFTSSYVISNLGAASTGLHTIVITGTGDDPETTVRTTQVSLNLAVANPGAPVLLTPADGTPGVSLKPTFTWTAASDATSYDLVVATDPALANVVYAVSGITDTSHTMSSSLAPSSNFYWRVTANNVCGAQSSGVFNFGTVILVCETFSSTDVPLPIPDQGPVTSSLTVGVGGIVADVNVVNLVGTHTYMGDLDFNVESPASGSVMVMGRACGTDEDFDINLDDEAPPGAWPCPPTDGGTYQPTEALAAFDGEDSTGTWNLVINDNAGGDSGELESWGLEICTESNAEFVLTSDPTSRSVCAGTDAVYTISLAGLGADVTLSATSVPAGAAIDFSQNPVSLPGSSTLTVSDTQNIADGGYTISVDGDNGTSTESVPVGLDVFGSTPAVPILSAPADGAVDVSPTPTFVWGATSGAASFTLTVAEDPGFSSVVYEVAGLIETTHIAATQFNVSTTYYWMVTAENPCGPVSSGAFSFTTRSAPPVLLVDDDDNSPDVRATYTDALTSVGLAYDVWDTENTDTNEPDAADLAPYEMVVWFTGDEFGGAAGPGSSTEAALATWLDAGGCLFISAQDYFYDKGLTTFMQDHLGVASVTNDENQTTVTGDGSVFTGSGPYSLAFPFSNFSDVVSPDGTAELAFLGDQGDAAVDKDSGTYRSTFWGFPFEALPSASDRQDTMTKIGQWCGVLFDLQPIFIDGFEGGNTDSWSVVQP